MAVGYGLLLGVLTYYWSQIPESVVPQLAKSPTISVIVAARNEAATIQLTLTALLRQAYSAATLEYMVINDHSTDETLAILQQRGFAQLTILNLEEKTGKKAALRMGISASKGDLLVFTDADCTMVPHWLTQLANSARSGADMVLAPVQIRYAPGFLNALQGLDVAGTMLLTGASTQMGYPLLANGANLAIKRPVFEQLNGYAGNTHRASGDDVFLLQKAVQSGKVSIQFLPHSEAIVQTSAVPNWPAFFRQRLRWASKTSSYTDYRLVVFQAFVYFLCVGLLLATGLSWYFPRLRYSCLLAWGIKTLVDTLFLTYACRAVGDQRWLKWFLPAQLVHTFYIVTVGTLALFPIKVRWKGRSIE